MPEENKDTAVYIGRNELFKRGWTVTLIAKFLFRPDRLDHDRTGGKNQRPSHLFCLERVEKIERNPAFIERQEKARIASGRATDAANRKKDLLFTIIKSARFFPLPVTLEQVMQQLPPTDSDQKHELALAVLLDSLKTDEDKTISCFSWHTGIREIRLHFEIKKLQHIATLYPELDAVVSKRVAAIESEMGAGGRTT